MVSIYTASTFDKPASDVQGGDTRREEVLPKGIVDISIHITSHASVTAQN